LILIAITLEGAYTIIKINSLDIKRIRQAILTEVEQKFWKKNYNGEGGRKRK